MNLYKKPLSSSQYCHTEEEAVTNIGKVYKTKKVLPVYYANRTFFINSIFCFPQYLDNLQNL